MSGWRAAIVAAAVGTMILLVGWLVSRGGGSDGDPTSTTAAVPAGRASLSCPLALESACRGLATHLGAGYVPFDGSPPGEHVVILAPAADLPEGVEAGPRAARSPIALMVWRERSGLLTAACGSVDLACLESAYGRTWEDLGGDSTWGGFKLGLADPSGSTAGLAAWSLVAAGGVPGSLSESLRLRAEDDGALMQEIAQFGDSRADAAVTTEIAIASQFVNVQGRGGRFEVFYPASGPWVDYVTAANSSRARDLAARLLEADVQALLGPLGLRPASGEPADLLEGLGNPGNPTPIPTGAEADALLTAWNDLR